jgi:hypothetical protein
MVNPFGFKLTIGLDIIYSIALLIFLPMGMLF